MFNCLYIAPLYHLGDGGIKDESLKPSSKKKQSLRQPYKAQLLLSSEPALGCLCTTQALGPCAGKSSWGRASNPQEDCPVLKERGRHNDLNTTKRVKNSWAFTSPVGTRYSLMLQLGGLLPQLTPGHQVPINSWVDWSNMSKVSCSRKQQQHQSGITGNRTWDLLITRQML